MGWNWRKWGAMSEPPGLAPVTPNRIVTAALRATPEFIQGATFKGDQDTDQGQ